MERSGPPPTRRGYEFGDVASALQKSIRRGQEDDALYWAIELAESGFDNYVWKRIRIMVSEDIGIANETLPAVIHGLWENYKEQKKLKDTFHRPERLFLVHAIILLARSPKSRMVDHALWYHYSAEPPERDIPDCAHDKHTKTGKRQGRSWEHFFEEGELLENESPIPDNYREVGRKAVVSGSKVEVSNGGQSTLPYPD